MSLHFLENDMPWVSGPKRCAMFWNVCKTIFRFIWNFSFNKILISSFWDLKEFSTKVFDEKLSCAPISFKLESAYVSEDSNNMKKKNNSLKKSENYLCIRFRISRIFSWDKNKIWPLLGCVGGGGYGSTCRSLGQGLLIYINSYYNMCQHLKR